MTKEELIEKYKLTNNEMYVLELFGFGVFSKTDFQFRESNFVYYEFELTINYTAPIEDNYSKWKENYSYGISVYVKNHSRSISFNILNNIGNKSLHLNRFRWNNRKISLKDLCLDKNEIDKFISKSHSFYVAESKCCFVKINPELLISKIKKEDYTVRLAIKKYEKSYWRGVDKDCDVDVFEMKAYFISVGFDLIYMDEYLSTILPQQTLVKTKQYQSHRAATDILLDGPEYLEEKVTKQTYDEFKLKYNPDEHYKYLTLIQE